MLLNSNCFDLNENLFTLSFEDKLKDRRYWPVPKGVAGRPNQGSPRMVPLAERSPMRHPQPHLAGRAGGVWRWRSVANRRSKTLINTAVLKGLDHLAAVGVVETI